jgi:tetratricopeptide (TPR) repeat protein
MDDRLRHKLLLAREHFERREFEHAEPLLLQVLEKAPTLADVHNMLGMARHERGEFEAAREAFEAAVRANPNYTEALLNLVVTCNDLGDYDAGKRFYESVKSGAGPEATGPDAAGSGRGSSRDPYALGKIANMHADVSEAYAHAGYVEEAVLELEKAVTLRPTFVDLRVRLGCMHRDRGDLEAAQFAFEKSIESKPDYAPAHLQLGITHYMRSDLDAARGSFDEALRLKPGDKIAAMYLRLVDSRR